METPPFLPSGLPEQRIKDAEHLRLLCIFHYVVGGFTALFSSLFLFHFIFGILIITKVIPLDQPKRPAYIPVPIGMPSAQPLPPEAADQTPAATRPAVRGPDPDMPFPPTFFGYMMAAIGGTAVLVGWSVGAATIYSGRCISGRQKRIFSLVIAGTQCMFFPFGTALGIFTFIVLTRATVMALYQSDAPPA